MAYSSASDIIGDAMAELGLGSVTDVFGSVDANVIQLRALLKSSGRKMVRDLDWSHLRKEYSFVTRRSWEPLTLYVDSTFAGSWGTSVAYAVGNHVYNNGNLYTCTTAGTSATYGNGPSTIGPTITDGTAEWEYQNAGNASIVVSGGYYYTCSGSGTSGAAGLGPYGTVIGATEVDPTGNPTWTCSGLASDYALPSDFSNLIDQTGWNRTNRLPMGGPVDGQAWQYLKGRQQGVVFNALFRQTAGVMRLYPDTDTPGGYAITFEYTSSWWVGSASSTAPTTDAATANGDLIYFDGPLMVARLKMDWLKGKGFDSTHAEREYRECLEEAENADNSAPVLNLSGRGPWDPLLGAQNIPPTGFGS